MKPRTVQLTQARRDALRVRIPTWTKQALDQHADWANRAMLLRDIPNAASAVYLVQIASDTLLRAGEALGELHVAAIIEGSGHERRGRKHEDI